MTRNPLAPRRHLRKSRFSSKIEPAAASRIRRALLRWFARHSRSLPWQQSKSAYGIWVSEIMLQQTQVSTVIPYYQRFMNAFPTAGELAAAPLERVLELWSGLGYYRRARMLHQAAQVIIDQFDGEFPNDYVLARSLPGVGDYTARAVLSIAYQQAYFVLDGNVARVVARLLALRGNIHQKDFRQNVESALDLMLCRRRPGDFNQALMQLGQLVCTPAAPQCSICPLKKDCAAFQVGSPEKYPEPRSRRAAERHFLATAVVHCGKQVALVRGLDDGLLEDLWNFPSCFGQTRKAARECLTQLLARILPRADMAIESSGSVTHNITHRVIRVDIYEGKLQTKSAGKPFSARPQKASSGTQSYDMSHSQIRFMPLPDLRNAAISCLARKVAEESFSQEHS